MCLLAYLQVLATSYFNDKLFEYISCILLLNYFQVCSGIQFKDKATLMSFFCELNSHMLGEQNAFQEIVIFVTLKISLN